jgi:VanZ family protein
MRGAIIRWGPAIIIMLLIFASSIPGSDLPRLGEWDVTAKKAGHMLGYALLAAAYAYALSKGEGIKRTRLFIAFCMACMYAFSDEFHQSFVPGRSPSLWDVCIDAGGAMVGLAAWCWIRKHSAWLNRSADL